jgi:hypothetical protein
LGYRVPSFPLKCNVWTYEFVAEGGIPAGDPRITDQECQLTYGSRVNVTSTGGTGSPGVLTLSMSLLLPPLADIRGPQDTVGPDFVECPAGTGRYYRVVAVDDIGKGFPNEHRSAQLFALGGTWVAPYE